jgi:hypothetical protein
MEMHWLLRLLMTVALAAAALAAASVSGRRFVPLAARTADALPRLQRDFHRGLVRPARDYPVVGIVFTLPSAPHGKIDLTLRTAGTSRPSSKVFAPLHAAEVATALSRAGYYLASQDRDGAFLSVQPLGDPFTVRGETLDSDGMHAVHVRAAANAHAFRVPFARLGRLSVFRTAGGQVSDVYLSFRLDPVLPPSGGARYTLVMP